MQVCLCVLKRRKAERGDWGEGAEPPPKQNDKQDLFSQAMLQAKTSVYVSVFIFCVNKFA